MPLSLLVLTDFHRPAHHALNYAARLAEPLGAPLILLHVRRDSLLDPELLTGRLADESQEGIKAAMQRLTEHLKGPVLHETGHGRVADAVADALRRHPDALLVLGLPDTGATPDELVSTTALDILRASPVPMLVVPHDANVSAIPRRLLLAVDADDFTLGRYAGAARHLLNTLNVEVTILQVAPSAAESWEAAALDSVTSTGLTSDLRAVKTRGVVNEDPTEGILAAAIPAEFDMVALVARPRNFLGALFHRSVTARVLLNSRLPVLVLPAE